RDISVPRGVHFSPEAKCLAVLPPGRDKLVLYRVDIGAELAKAGGEYVYFVSKPVGAAKKGKEFAYPIVAKSKSPAAFKLEGGPAGMTVTAQGLLKWAVPAN